MDLQPLGELIHFTARARACAENQNLAGCAQRVRDRLEEGDRYFFERVAQGYEAIAAVEPGRVRVVNGTAPIEVVCENIWELVRPNLPRVGRW